MFNRKPLCHISTHIKIYIKTWIFIWNAFGQERIHKYNRIHGQRNEQWTMDVPLLMTDTEICFMIFYPWIVKKKNVLQKETKQSSFIEEWCGNVGHIMGLVTIVEKERVLFWNVSSIDAATLRQELGTSKGMCGQRHLWGSTAEWHSSESLCSELLTKSVFGVSAASKTVPTRTCRR